jgi:CelD/BcsL family acetyltransferase involved in cellulose biosynthesis
MMPRGGQVEELLRGAVRDGFNVEREGNYRTPYITLSRCNGADEPFTVARSGKLRHNLRNKLRKVEAQGGLLLRRYTKADPQLLQKFYEMEHSGWKIGSRITAAANPRWQIFCDEIAQGAEKFGYLSLYFLELKGLTVAAHFGFICGGRYYFFKIAVNTEFSDYGAGHLSVNAVLRDCIERGLTEFDFTGYIDDWKLKWTDEIRSYDFCSVFRRGLYGYILHAVKFPGNPVLKKTLAIIRALKNIFIREKMEVTKW